jgi:hypothetical protein
MKNKVLPILGFTIGNGLLLDLDHFTPNTVLDICENISKDYSCGDVLLMKSSSKMQMTLYGEETFGWHAIFGKQMTEQKIQCILNILAKHRIIEELFRFFHKVEHEQTLRLNPKRKGEPWPKKFAYIHTTGEHAIIDTYLENLKIAKKTLMRRCI